MSAIRHLSLGAPSLLARRALFTASLTILFVLAARAADPTGKTQQLIAVLQSDTALFDKARACQQLGEIGSAEAVPALAALLTDLHLSAYARSGLEGIPDPSAAAALRDAAQKLHGPLLAGVVNSLGVLHDRQAVELLIKLAADAASGSSNEALLALGNISTPESIHYLRQVLTRGPDSSKAAAAAACLLAADAQRIRGEMNEAASLYDLIRNAKVPTAYLVAATRGAILARNEDRVPFLIEQLRSDTLAIRNAALLTIREIPDDRLATALNSELARSTPEMQGQLPLALADCHNEQSIPVVHALAGSNSPEIRKTALTVLGRIGPGAAPALIDSLQRDRTVEEKSVVVNALAALEGTVVDDLLLQALVSTRVAAARIDFIRLLGARDVAKATPEILKQAGAPDKDVSVAALSALSSLAGLHELSALIDLTRSYADEDIRSAAENALVSICTRSGGAASEIVLSEFKQSTKSAERNFWISVLARVGFAKALPALETAISDPDPAVADNALVQLGHWPDPAPMDILLKAMETGKTPSMRKDALVSVIDLATTVADEAQRPEATIVQWLQRANAAAQSIGDQRRILGLLGQLKTAGSFRLLASYIDNPDLRTEAASGLVQIAPALAKGPQASELKTALEKLALTVTNADLRFRALQVAKTIAAGDAPISLFDGRSLAGWDGNTNVWRVRDSVIVGGSMSGNPRNEFLATLRSYTNFVLSLEYKLVGTDGFINSGVQFRSLRVSDPPNEMNGYQADIGAGHSGCLYDESRRNKFLARCSDDTIQRLEEPSDWNRYELRCEGAHIQIWLNGEKTVDYAEPDSTIPQNGLIGLQIHGGSKAEVSFRNIMIQADRNGFQ
jgi:HEAT repeat protein